MEPLVDVHAAIPRIEAEMRHEFKEVDVVTLDHHRLPGRAVLLFDRAFVEVQIATIELVADRLERSVLGQAKGQRDVRPRTVDLVASFTSSGNPLIFSNKSAGAVSPIPLLFAVQIAEMSGSGMTSCLIRKSCPSFSKHSKKL